MVDVVEGKRCPGCGETKPRSDFHKNASRKDGIADSCKDCSRARVRRYYRANREEVLDRDRARNKDPKRCRDMTRWARERRRRDPEKYRAVD